MKVVYISPHLSTGGLPRYLVQQVEDSLSNKDIVWVVEWDLLSTKHVVHRNKIIDLVSDKFITFGGLVTNENKYKRFEELVKDITPDVVHFVEFPESFIDGKFLSGLYKEKDFLAYETTHDSKFSLGNKITKPDKFIFVSKFHCDLFKDFGVEIELSYYKAVRKCSLTRDKALDLLGLDKDKKHILCVGIFTPEKNQEYMINIAMVLESINNLEFHFVGSQAENFEFYWKPLMLGLSKNCRVWGERDDVDVFYSGMDLLLFPSTRELMPLVPLEALEYNMPVLMNDLEVYGDKFKGIGNVHWLDKNLATDCVKILNILGINDDDKLALEVVKFIPSFHNGPKLEIIGVSDKTYEVEFIDQQNSKVIYNSSIKVGHWSRVNISFYVDWLIIVRCSGDVVFEHKFELKDKNILVSFNSKSLGDSIAWMPYVEEFRIKHNCVVYVYSKWNRLFENEYKDINFVSTNKMIQDVYGIFYLGCFDDQEGTRHKKDWRLIPMQQIASDILGLDYVELKPRISIEKLDRKHNKKYIAISEFSTMKCKFWNNPSGWRDLVIEIKNLGYDVVSVSHELTKLSGVRRLNKKSINETINNIAHSEAFIGVGSGLTWLAWALNKPVVMVSGFSDKFCEFVETEKTARIINDSVCHGCFNDTEYVFDRGDFDWCPRNNGFECSKEISVSMVLTGLKKVLGLI